VAFHFEIGPLNLHWHIVGRWGTLWHMPKRSSKDLNQRAALLVAQVTGQKLQVTEQPSQQELPPATTKNPAAVALGRLGGLKGGKARAERLSKKKRADIARLAAAARWKKSDN
jgi:hypothetical protein